MKFKELVLLAISFCSRASLGLDVLPLSNSLIKLTLSLTMFDFFSYDGASVGVLPLLMATSKAHLY